MVYFKIVCFPSPTSTEMEIVAWGRIYVQTLYLIPFQIFKIRDKLSKQLSF